MTAQQLAALPVEEGPQCAARPLAGGDAPAAADSRRGLPFSAAGVGAALGAVEHFAQSAGSMSRVADALGGTVRLVNQEYAAGARRRCAPSPAPPSDGTAPLSQKFNGEE